MLRICTLPELKAKIPEFERVLQDPIQFKELYRYAFGYVKSKDQKCMEVDVGIVFSFLWWEWLCGSLADRCFPLLQIAIVMWRLLLGNQSPHVESFATFLTERQPVKVINRDQWQSFLEFATTVSEDFHDYDEMSACTYISLYHKHTNVFLTSL